MKKFFKNIWQSIIVEWGQIIWILYPEKKVLKSKIMKEDMNRFLKDQGFSWEKRRKMIKEAEARQKKHYEENKK